MVLKNGITRRNFMRYATIGGIALPLFSEIYCPNQAKGAVSNQQDSIFRFPKDLKNLTDEQRRHLPLLSIPPIIENGAKAPIVVKVNHPMEPNNYVKSIKIINFADPGIVKGEFFFTPANGEAYIATQIRLDGGEHTVWAVVECSHGIWAVSKSVRIAAGGCG